MKCPVECHENSDLLLAYCSRTLDPETAEILEAHVARCPACAEFAAGQRAVWEALDAWEAAPPPADFDRRLYRRIGERVSWWERMSRPLRPVLARQGLPIAAAACLLVVAGILLERPASIPGDAAAGSPQVEGVQPDQVEHTLEDIEMLRQLQILSRGDAGSSGSM